MSFIEFLFDGHFITWLGKYFHNIISGLNDYSSVLSALGAFFAGFIALYLGDLKARFEKPKLMVSHNDKKEYPYFHTLAFEPYGIPVDIHGQITDIYRPGFNARVKIINHGKTTAKNVEAKVEKIEFLKDNNTISPSRFYHPTSIKWSGEKSWEPVDIIPKAHFFLDLFWSINETSSEIFHFNKTRFNNYGIELENDILREIIDKDVQPSQEIYWNIWADTTYDRGIPKKYDIQGDIYIFIIVNAENCTPFKFKAIVKWSSDTWSTPDIKICLRSKSIDKDKYWRRK